MKRNIPISEEMANYVESLDYSVSALRTLLVDAAERHLDTSPAFARWERKYLDVSAEFEVAKDNLVKRYVLPMVGDAPVNWHLDYGTYIITIEEVEKC